MHDKISVIIPTFNKLDRLRLTLFCLERQNLPKDQYEVIIINDGSIDGTREYLEEFNSQHANFRIFHQKNLGQAVARNKGLMNARHSIIVFIDDDLIVPQDFLKSHLNSHKKFKDDMVFLGRIFRINSSEFLLIDKMITKDYEKTISILPKYVKKDLYLDMVETIFRKKFYDIAWICFTGGNSSVRKDLLDKVGFFDINFYRWGPEDIELGYRFHKAGIMFHYCPETFNYHLDIVKDRNQMLLDTATNLRYLKKRYTNDEWIKDYVDFTSGGFSLEEFYCRRRGIPFHPEKYESLFKFRPFDYINLKSEVQACKQTQ